MFINLFNSFRSLQAAASSAGKKGKEEKKEAPSSNDDILGVLKSSSVEYHLIFV